MLALLADVEHLASKMHTAGIDKALVMTAVDKGYAHSLQPLVQTEKGQLT